MEDVPTSTRGATSLLVPQRFIISWWQTMKNISNSCETNGDRECSLALGPKFVILLLFRWAFCLYEAKDIKKSFKNR